MSVIPARLRFDTRLKTATAFRRKAILAPRCSVCLRCPQCHEGELPFDNAAKAWRCSRGCGFSCTEDRGDVQLFPVELALNPRSPRHWLKVLQNLWRFGWTSK